MPTFAILDNDNIVENTVVAESIEGLQDNFPDNTFVECTDVSGVGLKWTGTEFIVPPQKTSSV